MAAISRFHAVAEIGRIRTLGFTAWLLWLAVHLIYIVGFKSRVTTLLHWTVSFIRRARSERTITAQQVFARQALLKHRHPDQPSAARAKTVAAPATPALIGGTDETRPAPEALQASPGRARTQIKGQLVLEADCSSPDTSAETINPGGRARLAAWAVEAHGVRRIVQADTQPWPDDSFAAVHRLVGLGVPVAADPLSSKA